MIQIGNKQLLEHVLARFYDGHHNFETFKRDLVTFGELQHALGELRALSNMSEDRGYSASISSVEARVQTLLHSLKEGK